MNKLFPCLLLVVLFSCKQQSTEEKLKEFAIKYETESFKKDGENVESITLDSFKYSEASMSYYWVDKNLLLYNSEEKYLKVCKDASDFHFQSYIMNKSLGMKANDDSMKIVYQKANEPFIRSRLEHEAMDSMSKIADTSHTLYRIEYILKAKTNKQSYSANKPYSHFFRKSDMSEIVDTVTIKL